jgi:hypothetical protein
MTITMEAIALSRLTSTQPYQRDRDKPEQGVVASTLNLFRNGALGFIAG